MKQLVLCLFSLLLLTGCGGSSSSDSVPTFIVSAKTGQGGTVSPSQKTLEEGGTASFTITLEPGFGIYEISGCDGELSDNTFTVAAITEACDIDIAFEVTLPAPQGLTAMADDATLVLTWESVSEASSYNLFFDTVPHINPATYAANGTGQLVLDVTSPHTLPDLTNGTAYYAVVTAVAGNAESAASEEVGVIPEGLFTPIGGLNDTGIDWCPDMHSNHLDCPVTGLEGQDGDQGRDAQAREGTLTKRGSGAAGFDFTKLDAVGNALPDTATEWRCVRDNVTGLIWEEKTTDGGPQDRNAVYRHSELAAYVNTVNNGALCGADDWRLPRRYELLNIVHNGRNSPMIDVDFFQNMPDDTLPRPHPFWTADENWLVSFGNGTTQRTENTMGSDERLRVRLVRDSQAPGQAPTVSGSCSGQSSIQPQPFSTPSEDFIVHNNGTVTHTVSGLMWMRCQHGQALDDGTCTGHESRHTWEDALAVAKSHNFAGYSDWRLPNKNELASIIEEACRFPNLNHEIFPLLTDSSQVNSFWSSSPVTGKVGQRWHVDFNVGGEVTHFSSTSDLYIRLVRDTTQEP
ncbi:MAG: DUF1566 domain-containing protein [Marinobacter sp.]|nr:DUF1566 domain-containing protein [Marinobacter sp.]